MISLAGLGGCNKKSQPVQSQPTQQVQAPVTTYATPTPDELYQLVAPIALFPDNLVAQVLAASTFSDQISAAYQWRQQNSGLKGQQLMQAVNQQSWNDSVKGLTQFPDVLNQMATNLSWTSALGDAYFNAPQSVMNAIQVMRQRAYQAGNLKTTPQQNVKLQRQAPGSAGPALASSGQAQVTVVQPPPQTIIIQPAQPEVVYVPTYNPTVVYGAPVPAYPGYSTGDMVAASLISFGVGVAVGAAISGGGCCGWNSWGCGWHNSTVVYNHNVFISNSNVFVNRNDYYHRVYSNNPNHPYNPHNPYNPNNPNNPHYQNINHNNPPNNFNQPRFNNNLNQPQFRNQNAGNPGHGGGQPNLNQTHPGGYSQQQSRAAFNQNQSRPNPNQNQRQPERGYGQPANRSASNSAFGDYGQGGNARTNSARGQQSLQENRSGGGFSGERTGGGGSAAGGGFSGDRMGGGNSAAGGGFSGDRAGGGGLAGGGGFQRGGGGGGHRR